MEDVDAFDLDPDLAAFAGKDLDARLAEDDEEVPFAGVFEVAALCRLVAVGYAQIASLIALSPKRYLISGFLCLLRRGYGPNFAQDWEVKSVRIKIGFGKQVVFRRSILERRPSSLKNINDLAINS